MRVGGSRPNNIEYLKILPNNNDAIYFKRSLSLTKRFLSWVKGSRANENLSSRILGNEYCVTFSVDYKEDLDLVYKSVPYLIDFFHKSFFTQFQIIDSRN